MPTDARARLLSSAEELFYTQGIASTGLAELLEHSGVGRASFYRHFADKDALVVEFVSVFGLRWRAWLGDHLARHEGEPLALFDALAERFLTERFRGCAAINTMVEVADVNSRAFAAAVEHKRATVTLVAGHLRRCGREPAEDLAEDFQLLADGATVVAVRERAAGAAHRAKRLAQTLLAGGVPVEPDPREVVR